MCNCMINSDQTLKKKATAEERDKKNMEAEITAVVIIGSLIFKKTKFIYTGKK